MRRNYGVLRAILASAVEADLIARSPCRGIGLPSVEPLERRMISPSELTLLADTIPAEYRPMVYVGAALGLRWGECAGLKVGRLDLLRGTLTVAWQRTHSPSGLMVEGPPKSKAGRRVVAMPSALVAMLADHLARRGLTAADQGAYVFVSPDGEPLHYSNWRRRVWGPACGAANLPSLQFHDLRRLCATGLMAEGVDVRTAQARLGHSDPRLTLAIYAQATSEGDRQTAEQMGARFMAPESSREAERGG